MKPSGRPCECNDELVPGALFPWRSDLGIAAVERCDQCKRFSDDEAAAAAVVDVLGDPYRFIDDNGLMVVCVLRFAGNPPRPLTFDQGLRLSRRKAYK